MAEVHVLFNGSVSLTVRQLRLSVIFRPVQTVRIRRGYNPMQRK